MPRLPVLLVFLLLLGDPSRAASLSPAEAAIAGAVRAERARALGLLKETVDINSGTMNFVGVRQIGEVFAREFRELGFRVEWVDGAAFHRAGHLVAHRDGAPGSPKVLLIGHLDTVFAQDSPFQRLELEGPRAGHGPGVNDMKGGDVIIVQALRALKANGQLDRLSLRVVMTGDEEDSGEPRALSRQALYEAGDWADVALGFENADGKPENAAVSRRGAGGWQLEVTGTAAHSSQLFQPEVGAGAIYEAARILEAFRARLSGLQDLTFNPGVIVGGTDVTLDHDQSRGSAFGKDNVVSRRVLVDGDLRAVSPEQLRQAQAIMREAIATPLPGTQATLRFDDGYPPMAPSPGNERLLSLYDAVSRDLGQGPVGRVHPRKAGAADISFVADRVEMALDGLGLKGPGNHTVDETADLPTLESQTLRAAILLQRLPEALP
jgi:glutamate carboxypeptidase